MRLEDCRHHVVFDLEKYLLAQHSEQKDMTAALKCLIISVNEICNKIYRDTKLGKGDQIMLHPSKLGLLYLCNSDPAFNHNNKLFDRFEIILNEECDENHLFISQTKNKDFLPVISEENHHDGFHTVMQSISFKHKSNYSEEEIIDFNKSLRGCIVLKNINI